MAGKPCIVNNCTYPDAQTFTLDCRTQCVCRNGTYACASLCPQENILPLSNCLHPRLVDVPGQCCREWMCDSHKAQRPPECLPNFSQWSSCSIECGLGYSHRVSNLNPQCVLKNETRLCQLRPCVAPLPPVKSRTHHHIRKGHECRATGKLPGPVWLTFGRCRSRKKFRPRVCGQCPAKCCAPELSTTIKVEFFCFERHSFNASLEGTSFWHPVSSGDHLIGEYYSIFLDVEWILKCRCPECKKQN
ncbi:unnamed protein product [Bemisia tabaci]|uniref:VWFC domain-containing protein n=1 Tax=Bemisia tabaci TaxID=7038 RepID=A0A9P0CE65_BEMTA|nr:unnamed protein product [Bemisia tabaci]